MLFALAIASSLSLFLPFVVLAVADGVAKLPSNPGAFMPFTFGGVHTQNGKITEREELKRC